MQNNTDINNAVLTAHYMPRPRIDEILEKATRGKLVCVVAGAGYGKTQTVRHFIEKQTDAIVRWVQLTESDNITSRFWEHISHNVAFDNPELADKLREFGFPETMTSFRHFAKILEQSELYSHKTYLVLDDFHLLQSQQAITFAQRCTHLKVLDVCVIIISRKEPEINMVSLLAKGLVSVITEDELRFTANEIAAFLESRNISFSKRNLSKFLNATEGWAIAIQLLSFVLKRNPGNIDFALNTMKQNIFKLLESEAFEDLPEQVKKVMVKITLVSDLPLVLLDELYGVSSYIKENIRLSSFIWFDSLSGDYRIHPLYLEFLRSRLSMLSQDEQMDTYRRAAQWCKENNFSIDAIRYFAMSGQCDRILEVLFSFPVKLPHDTCEFILNIIESLDQNSSDINILLLKNYFVPLMLMGTGRYEEAALLTQQIISQWKNTDSPLAYLILRYSYSNLAYIDMFNCTVTHVYNMPDYMQKSLEYLKLSTLNLSAADLFYVPDIRSYACLVGEGADLSEFDQFLDAANQASKYISQTMHSMYYGYDDLVACEIAYFKNQPEIAKKHAHNSILKSREKKQYSIEAMAEQYLLRIAIHSGDSLLTKELLKQLSKHLDNPSFWNSHLLHDLFTGLFYSLIGLPSRSPSWLIMDEKNLTTEIHIPIAELIVSLINCLALKKYDQALIVLAESYPRKPQHRFLFSELQFALISAAAKIKTDDASGAIEDFVRAYSLSFNGVFEMFFIEMGKHLHPLITAALARPDCGIPAEWLRRIDRKASIYVKKAAVIHNAYSEEKSAATIRKLSEREHEVLTDLYYGLSREEIAENRYLSINTVKKILQSIYIKLNANNNVDAIRVAIERKIIE